MGEECGEGDGKEKVLRLGLLGCADIAVRRTLPALESASGVRLAAVASRDPDRAAAVADAFGAEPVADYAALLARADVNAVYIPLPPGLHHAWAVRALSAGKHVLVEKPTAMTWAETEDLVRRARERGLVLMENMTFPQHRIHHWVRGMLDQGELGELRVLQAEFGFPPRPPEDFRYRSDLGGGALLDVGVYPLQAARLFLGEDLTVAGAVLTRDHSHDAVVSGSVLLSAPGGRTAHLSFGFQHAYRCSYTLWGSTGQLTVERAFTPPPDFTPTVRVTAQDGARQFAGPADDQFRATMSVFVRAVRDPDEAARQAEGLLKQACLVQAVAQSATVSVAEATPDL
jgi:predicted dehydrogenase